MSDGASVDKGTRFVVNRTSRTEPPCPEAFRGTVHTWDRRTFKTPEEHDTKLQNRWLDRGTDHGTWRNADGSLGGIQRKLGPEDCWYVEVATLADLLAFSERHGEIVVTASGHYDLPSIEIYDDYRE